MSRVGIVGVVGVIVLSGVLFFVTARDAVVLPDTGASTPTDDAVASTKQTLDGVWECLPHKNTNGPQTAECALGLAVAAAHYGLDLAAVQGAAVEYTSGAHVRVVGTVVPRAALNTNAWQTYNMEAIIHVEGITKL